jgi:hypothetical protein
VCKRVSECVRCGDNALHWSDLLLSLLSKCTMVAMIGEVARGVVTAGCREAGGGTGELSE